MSSPEKIDLFRQLKTDFKQAKKPFLLTTTPGQYLAINGQGEPGGPDFQKGVEALYSVAFTTKMTRKANGLGDYVVCKLEALWWVEGEEDLSQVAQDLWQWKVMIRTPDCVGNDDVQKAVTALKEKGRVPALENINLEKIYEGLCVQMLHVGPYDKEHETLAQMNTFMKDNNLVVNGRHHDIYLSDPRRVEPERLKTLLRQPVVSQDQSI